MAPIAARRYGRFAAYYDFIYEALVDYAGDVAFLERVFRRFSDGRPRSILDLGCGTGNHDLPLARGGYEVTGLDRSEPMLAVARRKARDARLSIRFVRGDMRSFDLRRSFDAAVCMFGAFGYLTKRADALGCLSSVRRHLQPRGLFVFEFWHTPAVHPRANWFQRRGKEFDLLRLDRGRFDRRRSLLSLEFRFLVFRDARVLDRFDETHTLRTYTLPEMRRLLDRAGFEPIAMYAATPTKKSFERVGRDTFRVMAIARPRAQS